MGLAGRTRLSNPVIHRPDGLASGCFHQVLIGARRDSWRVAQLIGNLSHRAPAGDHQRSGGTVQCPNNGSTKAIFRLPQGFRPGRSSALPGHPVLGRDDGHRVGVAEGVATSGLRDQPLKPREHQRSRSVPSSHAGLRSAVAPKEGPRLLRPPWSRTDESVNFQRLFSFVSSGQGEVPGGGPQGRGTPWLRRDPQARPLRPELAVHSSLASLALTSGRLLSDRISPLGLARRLRSSGIHPPRGRLSPRRVIGGRRAVGRPPGAFFHSEPPAVVF